MMPPLWLLRHNLLYFAARNTALAGCAALCCALIVGALTIGDSLRASLYARALDRIGAAELALIGGENLFRARLAHEIEAAGTPEVHATAVLQSTGAATTPEDVRRVNQVRVFGIDQSFFGFAREQTPPGLLEPDIGGEIPVLVNRTLADRLGTTPGGRLVLRLHTAGALGGEAPMAESMDSPAPLRLRVAAISGPAQLGDFSLDPAPVAAPAIFMNRELLAAALGEPGAANLLLLSGTRAALDPDRAGALLAGVWQLEDLGLELKPLREPGGWQLRSRKIFLPAEIVAALPGTPVLTYFAHRVRTSNRSVPFAFVTAVAPDAVEFLPSGLPQGAIVFNRWLADELAARPGDPVALDYFLPDGRGNLVEASADFQLTAVVPMEGAQIDPDWTPRFPGLELAESNRDWQTSMPVDMDELREADEQYWEEYRAAPKAFVGWEQGQQLWSNRWGTATSIRFAGFATETDLREELRGHIDPEAVGLRLFPVREDALAGAVAGTEFGGLMLGFSFFLIASSLALAALLFAISVAERRDQTRLLLALGWKPAMVRGLLIGEGASTAFVGALAGILPGLVFAWLMLELLGNLWPGEIWNIWISPSAGSPALGALAGFLLPLAATTAVAILQTRRVAGFAAESSTAGKLPAAATGPSLAWLAAGTGCLLAAAAASLTTIPNPAQPALFFVSGALLVASGLCFLRWFLLRLADRREPPARISGIALREAARRPGRTLAVALTVAAGTFLVVASSAFRKEAIPTNDHTGPTGGFQLVANAAAPIFDRLGLLDHAGPYVAPFRVADGDDASCMNPQTIRRPRLLGIDPARLAGRFAFATAGAPPDIDPWTHFLGMQFVDGSIPAIADETSLLWSLRKQAGDVVVIEDESGNPVRLYIAAALQPGILQGALLVHEDAFLEIFPSVQGSRFFLIDCGPLPPEQVHQTIERLYGDDGVEMRLSTNVLSEFFAVENAYLAVFQVLGGLGMVLATAGLGLVALRNLLERRSAFALLGAVGWNRRQILRLAAAELQFAGLAGLAIGALGSAIALWPQFLASQPRPENWILPSFIFAAILCAMWASVQLALRVGLRTVATAPLEQEGE